MPPLQFILCITHVRQTCSFAVAAVVVLRLATKKGTPFMHHLRVGYRWLSSEHTARRCICVPKHVCKQNKKMKIPALNRFTIYCLFQQSLLQQWICLKVGKISIFFIKYQKQSNRLSPLYLMQHRWKTQKKENPKAVSSFCLSAEIKNESRRSVT